MKRKSLMVGLATVGLLGGGLAGPTAAAQASPAPVASSMSGANCTAWISGEWGHGKCTRLRNTGAWTMTLDVVCDAWWDADVHREAIVPDGGTVELQGHCNSSVVSATAGWGRRP